MTPRIDISEFLQLSSKVKAETIYNSLLLKLFPYYVKVKQLEFAPKEDKQTTPFFSCFTLTFTFVIYNFDY